MEKLMRSDDTCGSTGEANHGQILGLGRLQEAAIKYENMTTGFLHS